MRHFDCSCIFPSSHCIYFDELSAFVRIFLKPRFRMDGHLWRHSPVIPYYSAALWEVGEERVFPSHTSYSSSELMRRCPQSPGAEGLLLYQMTLGPDSPNISASIPSRLLWRKISAHDKLARQSKEHKVVWILERCCSPYLTYEFSFSEIIGASGCSRKY